jgi:hypothetical protein
MAGCCEHGDEPSGSGATELVSDRVEWCGPLVLDATEGGKILTSWVSISLSRTLIHGVSYLRGQETSRFYETRSTFSCSPKHAYVLYHEPYESSPHSHTLF